MVRVGSAPQRGDFVERTARPARAPAILMTTKGADSSVVVERRGDMATITLSRPDALNAASLDFALALDVAAQDVAADNTVRCVLLTGSGKAFCAGGDVREFAANADRIETYMRELTVKLHHGLATLLDMQKPLVVAVNGVAAGAGFGLAMSGDLVLASEAARFTPAYARLGAAPDGGFTYILPRLIGPRRAIELYLMNRTISATAALDLGLVSRVVPAAELHAAAEALADELATGPTSAFGATRRLFHATWTADATTQLEAESRGISASALSADFREGLAAFAEKRAPRFTGR
jgi:2-(1,2-epoxy-1,2-dihydrophenyl)acetyl-CoA isomerase